MNKREPVEIDRRLGVVTGTGDARERKAFLAVQGLRPRVRSPPAPSGLCAYCKIKKARTATGCCGMLCAQKKRAGKQRFSLPTKIVFPVEHEEAVTGILEIDEVSYEND